MRLPGIGHVGCGPSLRIDCGAWQVWPFDLGVVQGPIQLVAAQVHVPGLSVAQVHTSGLIAGQVHTSGLIAAEIVDEETRPCP